MSTPDPGSTDRESSWSLVWWLSVAQLASWGSLYYSFTVLLGPMHAELGWSIAELTGAFSVGLLVAGLAQIPVGALIDRHGARALMTGGSLLAAVLLVAWSVTSSLVAFYVIWLLLGIALATTLYEPAFAVLTANFHRRYRKAITTLTLMGGFASTVFIPVTQVAVEALGWRGAVLLLAAVNLLGCAPIHWQVLRDTAPARVEGAAAAVRRIALTSPALTAAARSPVFWGLLVCFTVHSVLVSAVAAHLVPLLLDRGADSVLAITLAAMFGPAQVAARLLALGAEQWLTAKRLGRISTLLTPVAHVSLLIAPVFPPALWLFPVVFGVGNGSLTIVRGTAVPELIGRASYGTVNGALATPAMLARAAGPISASFVWAAGGYDAVVAASIALSLVAAGAFWVASSRTSAAAPTA